MLEFLFFGACALDLVFEVRDAGRFDGREDCESASQPLIDSVSAAYTSLPALLHQVQSVTRQCAFERSDQLHQLKQVLGLVKEVEKDGQSERSEESLGVDERQLEDFEKSGHWCS